MKRLVYTLSVSAICCCVCSADEEVSSPRRRPRIRVYDESPRLIPVTREADSNQASREDMDRRIRQDRPLSTGLQAPGGAFSPIPSLMDPQWSPPQPESSEDQETGWIHPLEFLSEEDLYQEEGVENTQASDDLEPEIEITAWEDLQKEMFKQTLSPDAAQKPTMEEWVEMARESNKEADDTEASRGLDLDPVSPVSPVDSPGSFTEMKASGADIRERSDVSLFTPILGMEPRRGEPVGLAESDRREPIEFSGSRALFNQIKDNQASGRSATLPATPPDRSFARPQFEPLDVAPEPNRIRSAALPGGGFGGANAVTADRPLPGAMGNTRTSSTPIQAPRQTQSEAERFRPSENRIRSQLGPAGGLGF